MKILQATHHFFPCVGGMEKVVLDLSKGLVERGHQCDVVCLNKCAKSSEILSERAEFEGIKIFRVPFTDLGLYKVAPKVLDFVKDYDIVHVHGLGFFSDYLAWKKASPGKPLVLSTHGGIFHTKSLLWLKKAYFKLFEKRLLKQFSKIIAVSKQDFELFSSISNNLALIENGVEIEKFEKIAGGKKENLIVWGRISKNKRIDNLIKAMEFIVKEKPETKLFIVGEDWEKLKNELEELIKEKGLEKNVVFTGILEWKKLKKIIEESRIFVSASEYEGFGITTIEAMSAGLIPVVNKIKAFENLVQDEKNGFLVDFSNAKESGEKILEVMNLNKTQLNDIKANAKNFAKRFSWGKKVKEFEKIYENCLKGK